MNHRLIHDDCLAWLRHSREHYTCIFADPPDNINLDYGEGFRDIMPTNQHYVCWLENALDLFIRRANIVWLSYNTKWSFNIGAIVLRLLNRHLWLRAKPCVQTFTFGQHNKHDLGNCHRSLLRLMQYDAPLYPDQICIQSWRQAHGDKRANSRGKVPGDVFDFPRVTGNSKQRRPFCPTQLHEGLVERCIKLSTKEGEHVLDPFAGTGTTLRVCKRINRSCTLIETNQDYCEEITKEHDLEIEDAVCHTRNT
jgi:DNA modification methylase